MNISFMHLTAQTMLEFHGRPYFGYTVITGNSATIWIRKDLPPRVYRSVLAHEMKHANDRDFKSLWKREARGWWAGFKASPIGFFQAIGMSLTKERLGLYWRRWRDGF